MAKKILKVGGLLAAPFTGGASLALTAGLAGAGLASSLLKKKSGSPQAAPAPVMPIADDEAVKRARRRSVASQMQRGGRTSTMLTDSDNSTLGG